MERQVKNERCLKAKNPTLKVSLILLPMACNFILWIIFFNWIWKAAFIYKDGYILIAFNNHGEMYTELIISMIFLIITIPISLYIAKDFIKEIGKIG